VLNLVYGMILGYRRNDVVLGLKDKKSMLESRLELITIRPKPMLMHI